MSAYAGDAAEVAEDRRNEIPRLLDSLEKEHAILSEVFGTLTDRLELVLRPQVPHAVPGDDAMKAETTVRMHSVASDRLMKSVGFVQRMRHEMEELTRRLDV